MISQSEHRTESEIYIIKIGVSMQDHLTPSGKTTVETADSAIMSNITTLRRSQRRQHYGRAPRPQQTEQVTFKLSHTTVESPKDKCFKHFSRKSINSPTRINLLSPCEFKKKCTKIYIFSRTDHRV